MKTELIQFSNKFVKDILNDNAALFVGAGLSVSTGMVDWKNLLREIAEELKLDVDKENDLIALAQFYRNEKGGRGAINQQLILKFTENVVESQNHEIIAQLPIKTIWTTNYDQLIEKTIEKYGKTIDVKVTQENLAISIPHRDVVIYKMHGDILQPQNAVITKDDYESYNISRQLFTTTLQGDLVSKTFLFMGFSFEDPNLEYILSRIRILLGENTRDHYCFFRTIKEKDFPNHDEYIYAQTKLELKIKDLKRYSIQALLIDEYSEITDTLKYILTKLKRKNIFISGAAHNYGEFGEERANKIVFDLSYKLAEKGYKIISGFGLGIGSSVINGVLSYVDSTKKRHLDDYLILRPFPLNISNTIERKEKWKLYREDMISNAGIALFLFGNKLVGNKIVNSDGLFQEFEIACNQGVKVIPIGCTGYASGKLWEKVIDKIEDYYSNNQYLIDSIKKLGDKNISDSDLINNIYKSIDLIQNEI